MTYALLDRSKEDIAKKQTKTKPITIVNNCSLCAKHCAKTLYIVLFFIQHPQKFCKTDTMIIPTLHMQKVRIREVRQQTQDNTAETWQSRDSNPNRSNPKAQVLPLSFYIE